MDKTRREKEEKEEKQKKAKELERIFAQGRHYGMFYDWQRGNWYNYYHNGLTGEHRITKVEPEEL